MIRLHIAREGIAIPEMLSGFVLALSVLEEWREQETVTAYILPHWGFDSHVEEWLLLPF